jgi:hypothetical protein
MPSLFEVSAGKLAGPTTGGTVGVTAIAAGSFEITVTNVSGGSLSEAIVINFVALKGASS